MPRNISEKTAGANIVLQLFCERIARLRTDHHQARVWEHPGGTHAAHPVYGPNLNARQAVDHSVSCLGYPIVMGLLRFVDIDAMAVRVAHQPARRLGAQISVSV